MRINFDRLNDPSKFYYWVEERWPGFSAALTYQQQFQLLKRVEDSFEYVEKGWEDGKVVMLFNLPDRGGFIQLVAADSPADFANYLKANEAHVRLAPDSRNVMQMSPWDEGKEAFLQMIARLTVRASYERAGQSQPKESALQAEATRWREEGRLAHLFTRLGVS